MKNFHLLALALLASLQMACASTSTTSKLRQSSTKTVDLQLGTAATLPVISDIVVNQEKKSATAKSTNPAVSITQLKRMALVRLTRNHDADLVIEPSYDVNITNQDGDYEANVEVWGWTANYRNLRQAKLTELETLSKYGGAAPLKVVSASIGSTSTTTTKSSNTMLGVLAGGVLLFLLLVSS